MRVLIFTQKVDSEDPILGFFHGWVEKLATNFEKIEIVCLEKGKMNLPSNVEVHSLGKEVDQSKILYIKNFFLYLSKLSGKYDKVFVHMNQEYIILGGLYWKFKKIPVYFWRNHSKGSILTNFSVLLSAKVFCTSKSSYTAKFKKTIIMPVGVDTGIFVTNPIPSRKKYSICMVGRISPVKHIDIGLQVVKELVDSGVQVSLSVIGPVPEIDTQYFENLKKYTDQNSLNSFVSFLPAVQYSELSSVYNEYQICLNLTDTGSFDKTIVEAAACGVIPLTTNKSMEELLPEDCVVKENVESIKNGIKKLLDDHVRLRLEKDLESFAKSQSLEALLSKLLVELGKI